jgi:predicted CoA-binding protein
MQKEIINEEAAGLAEAHGVLVVMDKCMREEFKKLFG